MGANAQTTVPTFTAAQVLTADQMNQSARTGVPVFADTTARDAAFGGTGEKTLAEGQLCYVENLTGVAQIQYYDGASWVSLGAGALTYITGATFSSVSSVSTAASTFTATYANYLVLLDVTSVSTTMDILMRLRTGSTDASAAYWWTLTGSTSTSATNTTSIQILDQVNTVTVSFGGSVQMTVFNPQLARNTNVTGAVWSEALAYNGVLGAGLYNTTSYDALTFLTSTGTMSGNYRVYGYANS
jgi:hypothetical protein